MTANDRTADTDRNCQFLASLLEKAPFGVYVIDAGFRIVMMNAKSQDSAFSSVRPAVGRSFLEAIEVIWPKDVAGTIVEHFRHTLATGEPFHSSDYRQQRADIHEVEAYEWELHRVSLADGTAAVAQTSA